MKRIIKLCNLFILFAVLFIPIIAVGQTKTATSDSVAVILPIPASDIPVEIEVFTTRTKEIEKIIQPSKQIKEVDSVFSEGKSYLDSLLVLQATIAVEDMNLRAAKNKNSEWLSYEKILLSMQSTVNSRSQQLQEIFEELTRHKEVWDKTLKHAREKKVANALIIGSEEVISSIEKLKKKTKDQQNQVFILYQGITDEIAQVKEVIEGFDKYIKELQGMIFVKDSPVLWHSVDSTSRLSYIKGQLVETLRENTAGVNLFLSTNIGTVYIQIGFILLLLLLFLYLKRTTQFSRVNQQNIDEVRAAIILNRPIASALVFGLLTSLFFFSPQPNPIIVEFYLLVYMIPVIILAPSLVDKPYKKLLYIVCTLFIVDIIQGYLYIYAFANRVILIFIASITVYVLTVLYKNRKDLVKKPKGWLAKLINIGIFIYILLAIASIIGVIYGSVGFSFRMLSSVIRSMVFGVVAFVSMTILTSLLISLTKESKTHAHLIISKYQSLLLKRVKPIIEFAGFAFWLYATFSTFGIFDTLVEWVNSIMNFSWSVGKDNVQISLGGIISFFIILFISFILANAVKVVLADDWVKRAKIPRGVPQAISMTLRYFIIGFGIYLALLAANVDLGKFGLIAGALGVGIGFGLQGIVNNFISGLVLSYERPIHVGDTIEVNNLMGNVTEIGVRASKILTFDGSEVILPNGNLISEQVINWTLSDQQRRLKIPLRTSLESDPRVVIKIGKQIAAEHPNTLPNPEPMLLFEGYGDSSLEFTLYFWVPFNVGLSTKSDVALKIYDALKEEGYKVPIPIQKIYYHNDEDDIKGTLPPFEKGTE